MELSEILYNKAEYIETVSVWFSAVASLLATSLLTLFG